MPGVKNKTRIESNMTQGIGAKVPLNGPIAANAVITASATAASNHRSCIRRLSTILQDSLRAGLVRRSGRLYWLDHLGGTEYRARAVFGFDSDVRLTCVQRYSGLEALAEGGASRLELIRIATRQHLPRVYLRGAVPTDVDRYPVFRPGFGHDRRPILRLTLPREAESPVRLGLGGEAGVVDQFSVRAELRVERFAAPPDEHVSVGQHLEVTLGGREYLVWMRVLACQGGAHVIFVDLDHYAAGLYVFLDPAVVEDRYRAVGVAAGIVLPVGSGTVSHVEVALFPAKTPDDLSRLPVDLVHRASPAGRNEQVILVIYIYGVDVEVVESGLEVGGRLVVRLLQPDVVEAVPLEEYLPALDVDLLSYPLEHDTLNRTTDGGEIPYYLAVDRDQGCILWRDEELVVVPLVAVGGRKAGSLAVGGIEDHVLSLAVTSMHSLPPGEHPLSLVGLRSEGHHIHALVLQEAQPHWLSGVVVDHASVLPRTGLPGSVLGGDEDVAGSSIARLLDHLDDRRVEIRTRAEVPCPPCGCRCGLRPGAWDRIAAQDAAERDPRGAAGHGLQEPPSREHRVKVDAS